MNEEQKVIICPECRHEIYGLPCVHCGYDEHTGKITKKTSASGNRTLKELGAMWKAESAEFRKTHKWNAYCKKHRKK